MKRCLFVLVCAACLVFPIVALGAPLEDRVAALEKEAAEVQTLVTYGKVLLAVLGFGGVGAVLSGARWVRSSVRSVFDTSLASVGLDLPKLSEVIKRGELQTRIRRDSTIVIVSTEARRDLQVALQQEGFRKVKVYLPGQTATEAALVADLVVSEGWHAWTETLARDLGRDDLLIFTGPTRADIPKDLVMRTMLANTQLTLGLHAAALLARNDARKALV